MADLAANGEAELRPLRGGDIWAASRPVEEGLTRVAAALEDPAQRVLVGTIDDVVVGYAWARERTLADGRRIAVIDDLYVEAGARGVGVGEALMDELVAWARERGCAGIDAVALPGLRETKNFFEESGFTARLLVMHKSL